MILVDTAIREQVTGNALIENFEGSQLSSIAYDLRAQEFIQVDKDGQPQKNIHMLLMPGNSVFVSTVENIKLPNDMIGRVIPKNSRIREGLLIDAPVYQPGHHTRVFFRLTNISSQAIALNRENSYCAMMFETLEQQPEKPYAGTFQGELDYRHFGDYTTQFQRELSRVEEIVTDIKSVEKSVYANVITILSIFVAIFSLINLNINFAMGANINWMSILIIDLSIIGSIAFLGCLFATIVYPKKHTRLLWLMPAVCFLAAVILCFLC